MGNYGDGARTGFQGHWDWSARPVVVAPPPRMPDILGKIWLVAGVGLGLYAYLAVHLGLAH